MFFLVATLLLLTGADWRFAEVPGTAVAAVNLPLAIPLVALHTGVLEH